MNGLIRDKEVFENFYKSEHTSWDKECPDDNIVKVIRDYNIEPCRTLEIGCGRGTEARWIAEKGFNVDAIDISELAIESAIKRDSERSVNFFSGDFSVFEFKSNYDFIYDIGYFQLNITKEMKENIIEKIHTLLNQTGLWFSIFGRPPVTGGRIMVGIERKEIEPLAEKYFEIITLHETVFVPIYGNMPPQNMWCLIAKKLNKG
jgi:SAM-dependent methyltransferase